MLLPFNRNPHTHVLLTRNAHAQVLHFTDGGTSTVHRTISTLPCQWGGEGKAADCGDFECARARTHTNPFPPPVFATPCSPLPSPTVFL